MIISVHLPKTAGTSFAQALQSHFGSKFFGDYSGYGLKDVCDSSPLYEKHKASIEASLHIAANGLAGIECIHGHFFPIKYLLYGCRRQARFVTWMRHPVERVLSHYYYWQRSYDPTTSDSLHRRVVEEKWSVERFCLGEELRNHYNEKLWGFPLDYFSFVGITEFYEDDFRTFSKHFLNTDIQPSRLNVGDRNGRNYSIDESFRTEIESFHDLDMSLYYRALEMRLKHRSICKEM